MKNINVLGIFIVSILFGFSFGFQSIGAKYIGPFTFNLGKYIIAVVSILPLCFRKTNTSRKDEIKYGIIVGALLWAFSYLQQIVALYDSPGKIGFISNMFIVEVPIINWLIFKEKINLQTIFGVIVAVGGLLFLCDIQDFSFKITDLLIITCSLLLAIEIIVINRCCSNCDSLKLTFYNSLFSLIVSFIGFMFSNETFDILTAKQALIPMIYVGFGCTTIACSLQFYCQKSLDATIVSLLLALQTVFSAIAGYVMLNETLTTSELIGCALMLVGIVVCITSQRTKKEER